METLLTTWSDVVGGAGRALDGEGRESLGVLGLGPRVKVFPVRVELVSGLTFLE